MSKYRTRRQQKRDRTLKKIKKVILFIVLLSLAVVLAYYFITKKNRTEVQKIILPEQKSKTDTAQKISGSSTNVSEPATTPALETPAVDPAKTPPNIIKEKAKKTSANADTTVVKVPEKTPGTELSREKMMQIIEDISLQKNRVNSVSNCVTIRKTSTSNVDNVFDIAPLLRNKGFVISGRQTISERLEGIAIDASGSCITLTIGTL